eukprot:scaffold2667_cov196-Alexandrium_tamarense.AAC.3
MSKIKGATASVYPAPSTVTIRSDHFLIRSTQPTRRSLQDAWEEEMNCRLDINFSLARRCVCFGGYFYIDSDTIGTTMDELKGKLSMAYRESNTLVFSEYTCCIGLKALLTQHLIICVRFIYANSLVAAKSLFFVVLGFPTFVILWPKFFRQILFTPPKT